MANNVLQYNHCLPDVEREFEFNVSCMWWVCGAHLRGYLSWSAEIRQRSTMMYFGV